MNKSHIHSSLWHRRADMLPMNVRHHRWILEFKQSSFHHIAQALRNHLLHVFVGVPLYGMLLSPRPFRSRLARSPRSTYPELRPLAVAINVVRDTTHSFQAHGSLASHAQIVIEVSVV